MADDRGFRIGRTPLGNVITTGRSSPRSPPTRSSRQRGVRTDAGEGRPKLDRARRFRAIASADRPLQQTRAIAAGGYPSGKTEKGSRTGAKAVRTTHRRMGSTQWDQCRSFAKDRRAVQCRSRLHFFFETSVAIQRSSFSGDTSNRCWMLSGSRSSTSRMSRSNSRRAPARRWLGSSSLSIDAESKVCDRHPLCQRA
jgi:hypothetical protein